MDRSKHNCQRSALTLANDLHKVARDIVETRFLRYILFSTEFVDF